MSIGSLLGGPAASGLFQGAILQSGAASAFHSRERASEITERLVATLGGPGDLRTVPWDRLLEAQGKVAAEMAGSGAGLPFMPVVDGTVLPRPPMETVARRVCPARVMIGTNRAETTLFLAVGAGGDLTEAAAVRRLDEANRSASRAVYEADRSGVAGGSGPRVCVGA